MPLLLWRVLHVTTLGLAFFVCVMALAGRASAQTGCSAEADQNLRFETSHTQPIALALSADEAAHEFVWPAVLAKSDTALLWLSLEASDANAAEVLLEVDAIKARQFLPAATRGKRALNASALLGLSPGQRVRITTTNGRIAKLEAQLQVFSNKLPLDKPVLILAPHPDDAEIAAFGLYANRNSTVVTVTAGNAGAFSYCETVADPATHYRMKGQLRVIDSVTVPWQGGVPVERAYNLGYFDGRLQAMFEQPRTPTAEMFIDNDDVLPYRSRNQGRLLPTVSRKATWHNLVADLRAVLVKVRPAIVVAPDPRLDHHGDHKLTTVALAHALAGTGLSPTFLLYTNHSDHDHYPLGPAGEDLPPPPWCEAQPLTARSFYAHPLTGDKQRTKLMALESMHDLRIPPTAVLRAGKASEACTNPPESTEQDKNYLRRAVRPFELFFVVDRKGLLQIAKLFPSPAPAKPEHRRKPAKHR